MLEFVDTCVGEWFLYFLRDLASPICGYGKADATRAAAMVRTYYHSSCPDFSPHLTGSRTSQNQVCRLFRNISSPDLCSCTVALWDTWTVYWSRRLLSKETVKASSARLNLSILQRSYKQTTFFLGASIGHVHDQRSLPSMWATFSQYRYCFHVRRLIRLKWEIWTARCRYRWEKNVELPIPKPAQKYLQINERAKEEISSRAFCDTAKPILS